jgi:folate-binding protein YgfZ
MTASSILSGSFPATGTVAGREVTLHYGNIAAEYNALRSGAMLVDRSARGRMRFSGAKAAEMLTGLVTNDVQALKPGDGLYAAALTPKGKIVADLRVLARESYLLVDVPPRAFAGWQGMIKKYINPALAPSEDVTAALRGIGVFGSTARRIVATLGAVSPEMLASLGPYAHARAEVQGETVGIMKSPDLELEGYEIFVPSALFAHVWQRLLGLGATAAGLHAWEIARIEAGRPEWGVDMDESTIPQEANFDALRAISYTKGCYVGQEVVARVHFRGHVNKHLRGLMAGKSEPAPEGAAVLAVSGEQIGEVKSSALSPRLGAVALGMIRREVETGTDVTLQWDGGKVSAKIAALPLPL